MTGLLCLVGGDEFRPGNEPHDRLLCEAADGRDAYIVATAAREAPDAAVETARRWFAGLGLEVSELRVRTRTDARDPRTAGQASRAGLLYLTGGDPGRVVQVLRGSPVWTAMVAAWRDGAALAGSSAGAMALCEWTLVRAGFPGHTRRRSLDALAVVPGVAVLPHFDRFGEGWIPSAHEALGTGAALLGIDERTAALWRDGAWSALGDGAVTVIRGDARGLARAGEPIEGLPDPSYAT